MELDRGQATVPSARNKQDRRGAASGTKAGGFSCTYIIKQKNQTEIKNPQQGIKVDNDLAAGDLKTH